MSKLAHFTVFYVVLLVFTSILCSYLLFSVFKYFLPFFSISDFFALFDSFFGQIARDKHDLQLNMCEYLKKMSYLCVNMEHIVWELKIGQKRAKNVKITFLKLYWLSRTIDDVIITKTQRNDVMETRSVSVAACWHTIHVLNISLIPGHPQKEKSGGVIGIDIP